MLEKSAAAATAAAKHQMNTTAKQQYSQHLSSSSSSYSRNDSCIYIIYLKWQLNIILTHELHTHTHQIYRYIFTLLGFSLDFCSCARSRCVFSFGCRLFLRHMRMHRFLCFVCTFAWRTPTTIRITINATAIVTATAAAATTNDDGNGSHGGGNR